MPEAFKGFTPQTGAFLWELSFHNERPWFLAHKEEFETVLNRPFRALCAQTLALMRERFPARDFDAHVSRIYRDARRLRFLHPADGRLVELETPLPDYFEEVLRKLGKQEGTE